LGDACGGVRLLFGFGDGDGDGEGGADGGVCVGERADAGNGPCGTPLMGQRFAVSDNFVACFWLNL